ncbi:MAG: hypothetical protein NTV68_05850 [Methanomicrobiales archaeon]|nr:hypothetical protein [Methanomicrobiales archaeon]
MGQVPGIEPPDIPFIPVEYRVNILIQQDKPLFTGVRMDLQPIFLNDTEFTDSVVQFGSAGPPDTIGNFIRRIP